MSLLQKQPSETVWLYIEFASLLQTGDSLQGITSVTEATDAITIDNETKVGTTVGANYSGGVDGTAYHIVAIVTTTLGETLEADVYLLVLDAPTTTMVASYFSLLEDLGHYLFGSRSTYSADQTWDIEQCIKYGIRRVHDAHDWSFYRPVKTITTVDGTYAYSLPTGYESIESEMHYPEGEDTFYPPLQERHDSVIRRRQQRDDETGRPLYFSVRTVEFDDTVGSRKQLILYPTPDDAYTFHAQMTLRPTGITPVNPFPVGGELLAQLITESCLMAAERNFDDRAHVHTDEFEKLLPLAISMDQEKSSPTTLGPDMPRSERWGVSRWDRAARIGTVSLDGTPL